MKIEHNKNLWEKLGAAEGLWAALLLGIQFFILQGVKADPASSDAAFNTALLAERMSWEWMTFLRIVAGLMIIWWMGSLAGRLRSAEGAPGRLATIAFGIGALWGALWLASALFNSAAILFAGDYANPAGSRLAATLAIESIYILTPSIAVVLTFCVALVVMRFGGFPRWYGWMCWGASALLLVLAIADWYGSGNLSVAIVSVAIVWMALTSALLISSHEAMAREAASRRVAS